MATRVKLSARPDGRVERWREHRLQRRRQVVEAALVALERHGPETSLEQIATVAGIPKPKIYRHFDDKADLVSAIGNRLHDLVRERLASALRPDVTVREYLTSSLAAVLELIAEHPSAVKLLVTSHPPRGRSHPITDGARSVARGLIDLTVEDLSRARIETDAVEPLTHALVGSVLGATYWWLMQDEADRIPVERLVEQLTVVLLGAGDAALRQLGLALDPDAVIGAGHLVRPSAKPRDAGA